MTIRTILVDDETLAIQGLSLRLERHEDVEIVETCSNGREAIRAIKTQKPDLVFLDIQMPASTASPVIQGLMEVEPPLFVFVTAITSMRCARSRRTPSITSPSRSRRIVSRTRSTGCASACRRSGGRRRPANSRRCSPKSRPTRSIR
jgi:two-component system LytT family response regulator